MNFARKGLEATLGDSKKKYSDKVSALLSAWEYVTNYIPAAPPEAIQSVIEWAHRHTLTLVLRGEWPKLAPVAKTHLCVTLQRCASQLVQHPVAPRCTALLALVNNPWTHPILTSILNGQPDSEHEEEFCCSEKGELLTMRLKMLCEDRCEDIAVNLAAACVRSLRRSDRLRSLSESHHVHYMIDVYIVLLYKLKRTQDIFAQLKLMDLNDGLELVQRLSGEKPTKYGTARVWRNSIKAAELVAQYLVTAGMVRPISETGANILEQILNSWALLHAKLKDVAPTLPGMIRKLIEPAESAQHIYIFCAVLAKHFGESIKPLVIELYIRALTTDMNELESQKAKSDKDKERETAKRLSTQFLKLADVVDSNIGIAKECVLTAFSLHPTRACYDRIKELAMACGKAKEDGVLQEGESIKKEEPDKILEKNSGEDDLLTSTIKINVKSEIMDNNSVTETFSAQSSSLIDSHTQPLYQNSTIIKNEINLKNEQVTETFKQTDQLLKSLLTAKKLDKTMSDTTMPAALTNDKCPLHLKHESSSDKPHGELCFNCGEFTGSNKLSGDKLQASEVSTIPSNNSVERTLDTLILIKGETVASSTNYDEKSVPSQVLDGEKLGLSPQLCDDLAVVLNSPRFNLLSWVLDWKELKNSCEQYLENAEEMRNTNKELKYLNIDYSQFKDWPSEDDTKDIFFGIEKGYEQWADLPSDSSEQFGSFQPAAGYKRSSTRRSLDDTTTDSDSGSVLRVRRTARTRKIHRLESSESDYDSAEPKPKRFRDRISSVSDSDSNTQDSQTDSLGSDGCRLEIKKKSNKSNGKESSKKRPKTSKLTVESVSHFHMLVNEDARRTNTHEDASGSDVSSNDIITLFSADMDENKRETIKGSAYTAAAQLIITTTERRSDPAVLKSLRMYRPQNSKKKSSRISQILQKNLLNKSKDTNNGNRIDCTEQQGTNNIAKFAPMLSTLNLNPKIVLTRTDEADRKLTSRSKKQQQRLSSGDITSELINIKTTMPFSPNNKSVMTYQKKQKEHVVSNKNNGSGKNNLRDCSVVVDGHRDHHHHHHHRLGSVKSNLGKTKYDILAKAVRDSDILTKNVPGMNSLDMMVPPRQRSTVNVVQLSRNGVPQSPSSATGTAAAINVSGNTPPRPTRTPSVTSNQSSSGGNNSIQLPGTPSSTSGHDSGVGMSPAGQTPPLRSSSNLGTSPDAVGEEANQLPDAASPTTISPTISATTMTANNPSSIHQLDAATAVIESSGAMRTMAQIRRVSNQHNNQSPRKSPSSPCSTGAIAIITTAMTTTTTTTSPGGLGATPITSESLKAVICKPDGSYHITSLSPNQRNLLGLQNLDDGISFARQTTQQQQQQRVTDATGGASSNRNAYDRLTTSSVKSTSQSSQNAVLPKFNQAFRKTLYSMSTDTPASGVANAPNDTPLGNIQQTAAASTQKTTNLSKAVQTSVPNNQQQPQHQQQQQQQQQTNAGSINVQSIIPNLQLSANRQVVSIVPSSGNNGPANTAISSNQAANQTITQLVQNASSPNTGVIYTHKVITNSPNQLNIIPTISHTNSGRTPVVKLNIIRPVSRQQMTGAIQAVLQTPRLQQQQQQQQQAVRTDSLIGSPIEVNNEVSSTTLEQLREFESVLEQVKERSIQPQAHHSISNNATTTTVQTQTTTQQTQASKQQQQISVSALAQQLMMPTQSSTNNESFASNGNTVTFQQESVFSQKVSVAYVNQSSGNQVVTAKVAANSTPTPVVVVTSYCQPAASPALSVTSQSSSSPCVTPAPAPSAGKTPPTPPSAVAAAAAAAAKTGVKKSTPKAVKTSATNTSKASPIPKPQQKPQEDEQTAQRIYAILDEYAEQLRNSPDLNNKPAPRRRSNPPTNPSQSSKRKKSSSSKTKPVGQQTSELSPSTDDLGRTMGSEDSSSGVVHVQDSPAGFSAPEEPSVNVNVSSHVTAEASAEVRSLTSDSNDGVELNVKRRNLIFTEPGSNQPRAVIVQEALPPNSVSVSEALASVTSKIGGASVLMPGIVLPLVAKGTQYTIVSGNKILAVPTVRTSNNSNTLVLQSFLNQGKLITQPHVKQMKMQPTLQTLSNNQTLSGTQNVQSASVVIPQTGSAQFVGETATATITTPDVKPNVIGDLTLKNEPAVAVNSGIAVESAATNAAIVVNKSNNPTISLIGTRTINEISDNQQICGVITSNPTLQSTTRLFNSGIHKLSTPATLKADNVVCIAPAAAAVSHSPDKKSSQDGREIHAEKPVSIQTGATIALTFASQTDVNAILNDASHQQQKDTKEITPGTKIISPKKRKFNDVIGIQENMSPRTLIPMNIATSLHNNTKIESSIISSNKQSSVIDSTTQFLVTGGPSSSDSQESSMQQSTETIDGSCKVGNGMLYENARLQEAWESEGKISPDTPWRYNPTSMNTLSNDSLKGYSRDSDNSESVLQIINKGQGIEMASGQIYQSNTKKYFMNHTLDTSYSNKSNLMKSQLIPRMDRDLMQQRLERKAAAYERELKLQKSLSEECEDLGVDEPSTSDLFPEADLLFDTNHSPSFDHSQDASCSQSLGMKPYNSSYFRSLDSSSGSRDASPTSDFKSNECKRNTSQRARTLKDSLKRGKREKEDLQLETPAKHMQLAMDNLSQDEASNSNSDISRLSPANIGSLENDSSKDMSHHRVKLISRSGSKEGTPSSVSSIPSNMKLDIDLDSESLPPSINVNNTSAASSGDESLTLLSGNTADHHTIPSPLSPLAAAGPLLSTHKYTYTNKKRMPSSKMRMDSYMAWESPMSERTRSSSEDEDSSISESISSQPEDNVALSNGLEDSVQTLKSLSTDRRCTYVKKKDKLQVNARVVLNRTDHKTTATVAALPKRIPKTESIAITESMVVSSDKASEASEDEAGNIVLMEPADCRARRSSLRGHVKKGCACCNGSPERPKKKTTTVKSTDHKLKKRLSSKQPGKRR
ncbi:serine-rich adhesin for platelets isoform X2 [Polyergus mexicanus]|uniref:serine-rich adhesin for platelets isoform X2 n=1 Tax=Polyergus mexicanus TaxID=615972 RepID=UPI0038B679C7